MIVRKFADVTSRTNNEYFDSDLFSNNASDWAGLLQSRRVMLIAESGSGKTFECQDRQKILWAAGEPAFFLELSQLALQGARELLSTVELQRLEEWRRQESTIATFFVDSFDELKLNRGSFRKALVALEQLIEGRLDRTRIVVTTRPIPFDANTFRQILPVPDAHGVGTPEQFARAAMGQQRVDPSEPPDWRTVKLLHFSDANIVEFARLKGVQDPDSFFENIRSRGLLAFARRPLDLEELCSVWKSGVRSETQRVDIATNVAVKLLPHNHESADLSSEKALEGASRLAIAVALTRKRPIRYVASDNDFAADVLDPQLILTDWTQGEQAALLQRPMYSFASYGAVRFHHRTIQEYLAAERINALLVAGMSMKAAKRLLFGSTISGIGVVKPSMRPIAAWLGGRQPSIFDEVIAREPVLMLTEGDPSSLTPQQRAKALEATVAFHGRGGWQGLNFPELQARRFATPALAPVIEKAWTEGVHSPELRDLLLALIEYGRLETCADLAFAAATDSTGRVPERLNAIDALIALNDHRLPEIGRQISASEPTWANSIARWGLLRLFPSHIAADGLCAALPNLVRATSEDNDSWERQLSAAIADGAFSAEDLHKIRKVVDALLGIDPDPDKRWPYVEADRANLTPVLAVLCSKLLDAAMHPDDLLKDVCLVLRTAYDSYGDTARADLRSRLNLAAPALRKAIFKADESLVRELGPSRSLADRVQHAINGSPLHLERRDWEWLQETFCNPEETSSLRLLAACLATRFHESPVDRVEFASEIKKHVQDLPDALTYLAHWEQIQPDERLTRMVEQHERQDQQRKVQKEGQIKAWEDFWNKVAKEPDIAFAADTRDMTIKGLWNAMNKTGASTAGSAWNRTFIERQFNAATADRLRQELMRFWRAQSPALPSERPPGERNTYPQSWLIGLAGIAAESEAPNWSREIADDLAEKALRYAPWHLNSFPSWLDDIARDKPALTVLVLGKELQAELDEPAADNVHLPTLQNLRHSGPAIAALFLPILLHWLESNVLSAAPQSTHPAHARRLEQVVEILEAHGDLTIRRRLAELANHQLKQVTGEVAYLWVRSLMKTSPEAAVDEFERRLKDLPVEHEGQAVGWVAAVFGESGWHSGAEIPTGLSLAMFNRLLRLTFHHVRASDDAVHSGSYTPGTRDHAERARSALLLAFLNTTGPGTWEAKTEIADDPLFAAIRARIFALAREKEAEESDSVAVKEADLRSLTRLTELPPATPSDMFMLMHDRLDDLEDMLLTDKSPRQVWATIPLENMMRREIARELDRNRREAYTVDQEAVTADEKETDIRLRSPIGPQGIIELKVAEKGWSAADLKDTISNQLVKRYMAAEQSRSGCLVVTVAANRMWNHPDGGPRLDVDGLRDYLKAEAARVQDAHPEPIRIDVRILDLRPRLP